MKKILTMVGLVIGGSAVFLGASLMILNWQGRLEGENRKLINESPLLGSFISAPEVDPNEADKEQLDSEGDDTGNANGSGVIDLKDEMNAAARGKRSELSKDRSLKESKPDSSGNRKRTKAKADGGVTGGFSARELMDMFEEGKDARVRCEREWAVIENEKENLSRLKEDLDDREKELRKMMSDLATKKSEMEAVRAEFRQECVSIGENEDKMIRMLAELYENMKDMDSAAEQFNSMDIEQAVKIIARMDTAKSAKIIPLMDADKVKLLMEKLSRFQERKTQDKKGKK